MIDSTLDVHNSDSIPETPALYLLQLFQRRQTLQSRSGSSSERLELDSGLLWGQEIDICLVFLSNLYFLSKNSYFYAGFLYFWAHMYEKPKEKYKKV